MERPPLAPELQSLDSEAVAAFAAELGTLLSRNSRVDCAWLFGSVARGEAGPLSDVDIAVLLTPDVAPEERLKVAIGLVEALERRCGRVDLVLLDEGSSLLKHRVLLDGILLVERDENRRIKFEARAIQAYLDFLPLSEIYDRELLERAAEGRLGL
jgi:predicted nucleotidyltransferase